MRVLQSLGLIASQLIYRRTILVLVLLFSAAIGGALWNVSALSDRLIQTQALDNASFYAQSLKEARTLYSSEAVTRVLATGGSISARHDYSLVPDSIPLPATFLIELGERIRENNPGISVRLYSDYPFPWRAESGGPRDDFEREALTALRRSPDYPFSRFETVNDMPVFRYAQADIMRPSCIACHNTDPNSPKTDWKVGDVRGVLEVTQPVQLLRSQTRTGLRSLFVMLAGLALLAIVVLAIVIGRLRQTSKELELRVIERTAQLQEANQELVSEQEKSERLLLNVLPPPIAARLKNGENTIADRFGSVTILFADLVGFTELAQQMQPESLVALLNEIFSAFDRLSDYYGLEKIKTIGDAYMVVGGLLEPDSDGAEAVADMALAMQEAMAVFNRDRSAKVRLRIGLNVGPVVAGVIGRKKFAYDLWGDAVNLASRMESHGVADKIQASPAAYDRLKDRYTFEPRHPILVKGKGRMPTYFLTGRNLSRNLPGNLPEDCAANARSLPG